MESTNINTNVAQIILPPDMEIRKIRKSKPKTSSEKKKVLKELKETLKAYDSVVAIAADKNIQLPAQLGILPDNIADINSVKELKAFNATLKSRIEEINKLIAQGAQKQQTSGLFSEGTGQRLPFAPTRIVPSPMQPNIIQPQVPQTQPPINPNNQQPDTTQAKDDGDTEKTLDQIRQEILDKLSPEDRAKAEKQLEEEKKQQPAEQPAQQPVPQPVPQPAQQPEQIDFDPKLFVKDIGFDTGGGKRVNIVSPIGWTEIYTPYRQYIENITFKLQKVDKGIFVLPIKDEEDLNTARVNILNNYSTWSRGLVDKQNELLDTDPLLKKLNNDMLKELELDPKDIVMQIAKAQNIDITEITDGQTRIEKAAKAEGLTGAAKDFQNRIKRNKTVMDNIVKNIDSLKEDNKLLDTIKDLTTEQAKTDQAFNRLAGPDRVQILSDYEQFQLDLKNIIESVDAKRRNEEIDIDPNTYKHSVKPDAAPAERDPAIPEPKPADAGSAISGRDKGKDLGPTRYIKNKITVANKVKGALSTLNKFSLKSGSQFTDSIASAIDTVINEPKLKQFLNETTIEQKVNNLSGLPPRIKNNTARELVKEDILNNILI